MHKTLHGVIMGAIIGAITPLLAWEILTSTFTSEGKWNWGGFFEIVLIYIVLGAIVGTLLPKHK